MAYIYIECVLILSIFDLIFKSIINMAILKGNLDFTGSMGGVSAYKRHDSDKTILRGKGGATKKKIYSSPSFVRTRENFTEFGLCGKMGGCIRRSMISLGPLADYNFTPRLTTIAKIIQTMDTENIRGERNVQLSAHKHLLTGFSLNKKIAFESIVKPALPHAINRAEGNATVQIPGLIPGINFSNTRSYPFYRFIINLGCVKDKVYKTFQPKGIDDCENCSEYSEWRHSFQNTLPLEMSIKLSDLDSLDDTITLILSVGIQFGTPLSDAIIQPVKYAGCAKIIAVA